MTWKGYAGSNPAHATYKYGIASTPEKEKERKIKISLALKGNKIGCSTKQEETVKKDGIMVYFVTVLGNLHMLYIILNIN